MALPAFLMPVMTTKKKISPMQPCVCRRDVLSLAIALSAARCLPPSAIAVEGRNETDEDEVELFIRGMGGLEVRDYRVGAGKAVSVGDVVVLKWTGRLADRYGWPFQREEAGEVTLRILSNDDMVEGFSVGLVGDGEAIPPMREGGKRRLVVPKELGYMREGQAPVPSDFGDRRRLYSTVLNKRRFSRAGGLVFDVELKKIKKNKRL